MDVESHDRIRNVAEDLLFITEEWDQSVDDHSLRRSIGLLRRLLVEGELGRAWRDIGLHGEPTVRVPIFHQMNAGIPPESIRWAQACGATYQGAAVFGVTEYSLALTPEQVKALFESQKRSHQGQLLPLSQFIESTCIIIQSTYISRRVLIKYIANKLGGVHPVSHKRNLDRQTDQFYILLDQIYSTYKILDKNAIYFEILSIGQALVNSEDIRSFLDRARYSFRDLGA